MPKTNSLLPGITIISEDSDGKITLCQSDNNLSTVANLFAKGCVLENRADGKVYYNAGTIAVPSWNEQGYVTTAEIDPALIQYKEVALTAAQINGMYATPVEIIPAVSGKNIILESFIFDLTATATQFASGGVVNLQYKNTVNGAGTTLHADIAATVLTGATARVVTTRIPAVAGQSIATADITGVGVFISNKSGAFTTGTGTAVCKVAYRLV